MPSSPTSDIVVGRPTPTAVEASRFLAQGSMGATRKTIDQVIARNYEG